MATIDMVEEILKLLEEQQRVVEITLTHELLENYAARSQRIRELVTLLALKETGLGRRIM